jgi:hypothetical protein
MSKIGMVNLKPVIDKKVIFDERYMPVGPPPPRRLSANFVIRITFLAFQPRHFFFSG